MFHTFARFGLYDHLPTRCVSMSARSSLCLTVPNTVHVRSLILVIDRINTVLVNVRSSLCLTVPNAVSSLLRACDRSKYRTYPFARTCV